MPMQATSHNPAVELPATLVHSRHGDEAVTVSLVDGGADGLLVAIEAQRDGEEAQTMQIAPQHLIGWRRQLGDSRRVLREAYEAGVQLDPHGVQPSLPRPLPRELSRTRPPGCEEVTVQIIHGAAPDERLVEVRVGNGDAARAVTFLPGHLNSWRGAMPRAAPTAWRTGGVGDEFLNSLPS